MHPTPRPRGPYRVGDDDLIYDIDLSVAGMAAVILDADGVAIALTTREMAPQVAANDDLLAGAERLVDAVKRGAPGWSLAELVLEHLAPAVDRARGG